LKLYLFIEEKRSRGSNIWNLYDDCPCQWVPATFNHKSSRRQL